MVMKPSLSSFPSGRRFKMRTAGLICATLLLAACGSSDNNDEDTDDPSVWHIRGVNVIQDAPVVQFYVDDTAVTTAAYGAATDYRPAPTGERGIRFGIRNPSDLTSEDPGYTDIGTREDFDFQGPTDYTVIATGTVAAPRQFVIEDTERDAVADNQVEYQVVHAAVDAPAVEVFLEAPDAGIDTSEEIGQLSLGEYSERTLLDLAVADDADEDDPRSVDLTFEVRDGGTVLYNATLSNVAEQTRVLVVIADNIAPLPSAPVKLFVVRGTAADNASTLRDAGDAAELRLANVSPDAGAIDLIVGDEVTDVFAANVAYDSASAYGELTTDPFNSITTPTGNPGVFYFVNTFTGVAGRSSTLYAQGPLSSIRGILFSDDRRSVPTEARFRFLHVAQSEEDYALDIYLQRAGETLDLTDDDAPGPNVADLAYRGLSDPLILDEGSYQAYFTRANDTDIALGPVALTLTDGAVQTLVLTDSPDSELAMLAFDDARN
jgi:major membrane immunogen (membrane-anchored lipoprotein)